MILWVRSEYGGYLIIILCGDVFHKRFSNAKRSKTIDSHDNFRAACEDLPRTEIVVTKCGNRVVDGYPSALDARIMRLLKKLFSLKDI